MRSLLGYARGMEKPERIAKVLARHGIASRREAEKIEALFILMGAHGKSAFKRFLFGATTLGVLHQSSCPILFVPSAVKQRSEWWAG